VAREAGDLRRASEDSHDAHVQIGAPGVTAKPSLPVELREFAGAFDDAVYPPGYLDDLRGSMTDKAPERDDEVDSRATEQRVRAQLAAYIFACAVLAHAIRRVSRLTQAASLGERSCRRRRRPRR
jgi:hypothetical protein